jgi:carotenoid cleavage dioxygenase-like enzyme
MSNMSELLILHARDIAGKPAAAAVKVSRRVPAGFHGNFVGAQAHRISCAGEVP